MRSETASKDSDVPLRDCLQQVEKYDSDSSSVYSEEEVGDEDEEEDGMHLRLRCCRRSAD